MQSFINVKLGRKLRTCKVLRAIFSTTVAAAQKNDVQCVCIAISNLDARQYAYVKNNIDTHYKAACQVIFLQFAQVAQNATQQSFNNALNSIYNQFCDIPSLIALLK